jgi:dTDP-glucose pyrophosphorylase/mannose-6-phosphate isomerase-like protein (cupin superfamily)
MNRRSFEKIVEKPWGREEWIVNKEYCGKIIIINKNHQSSFHYHKKKNETFYVLEGKMRISMNNGREEILGKGDILDIPTETLHRLEAVEDCRILEISTHHSDADSYRILDGGETLRAVILCGGRGERMKPFTYEMPKPLFLVQGKSILEHIIDVFKKFDIRDVTFAVGYLKERIKNHFGDGLNYGIRASYIEEESPLGTAGPLKSLEGRINGTFIVSNGDELKDLDIDEMLSRHKSNKAITTIALTEVENPSAYGVAKLVGDKILEFVEKPLIGKEPSRLINAGFYILEPQVLEYIPKGFAMLERDVFPKIAREGRLYGYKFKGQWFDTGNLERYEIAIKNWQGVK